MTGRGRARTLEGNGSKGYEHDDDTVAAAVTGY
jgi:hypothetical protein